MVKLRIIFAFVITLCILGCSDNQINGSIDIGSDDDDKRPATLPPSIIQTCPNSIVANQAYSCLGPINIVSVGGEGAVVWSFDVSNTCTWALVDLLTGSISGTPLFADVGSCNLAVRVTDNKHKRSVENYTITVEAPNSNPSFSQSCPTAVMEDSLYQCLSTDIVFTDADLSDVLTFSLDIANDCDWIDSINSLTGEVSGTPQDNHYPGCQLGIRLDDGQGGSATQIISIAIGNNPPTLVIDNADPISPDAGSSLIRSDSKVQASDEPHGIYSISSTTDTLPNCHQPGVVGTVSLDPTDGLITGKILFDPVSSFTGFCYIKIIFNDGNLNGDVSDEFSVEVKALPALLHISSVDNQEGYDEAFVNYKASNYNGYNSVKSFVLTVTNVGQLAATNMNGIVTGAGSTGYFPGLLYPGGGTCGATLGPNSSCTIYLFTSTGAFNTTSTNKFELTYDDGVNTGVKVEKLITNTYINSVRLIVTGNDFGSIEIAPPYTETFTNSIIIANSGANYAEITAVTLNAPFSLVNNLDRCDGDQLFNAVSCSVITRWSPTDIGIQTTPLFIWYNDSVTGTEILVSPTLTAFGIPTPVVVRPVYATIPLVYPNQAIWNHYVINDGTNFYNASNTLCTASYVGSAGILQANNGQNENGQGKHNGYYNCIHVGEKLKFAVPFETSCGNMTATDTFGVFEWECRDDLNPVPTFYSKKINLGKGLGDLVTSASSFQSMKVTTIGGIKGFNYESVLTSSAATAWWANTVSTVANTSSTVTRLTGTGGINKIYVKISNHSSSYGYSLESDGISFVMLPNIYIQASGSIAVNCSNLGEVAGATSTKSLICSGSHMFQWIEGDFRFANNTDVNRFHLSLYNLKFSRVHNSYFAFGKLNINLIGGNFNNQFSDIFSSSVNPTSIDIKGSQFNSFSDLTIGNSSGTPDDPKINIYNSDRNVFQSIYIYEGTGTGFKIENAQQNRLYDINVHGLNKGVRFLSSSGVNQENVFSGAYFSNLKNGQAFRIDDAIATDISNVIVTNSDISSGAAAIDLGDDSSVENNLNHGFIFGNDEDGVAISGSDDVLLNQLNLVNNGSRGLNIVGNSSDLHLSQLAVSDNYNFGINIGSNVSNLNIYNNIMVGNNESGTGGTDDCNVPVGHMIDDVDCARVGGSFKRIRYGTSSIMAQLNSYIGSTGQSHLNSISTFSLGMNIHRTESIYKFYGNSNSFFTNRFNCIGGTCYNWDFRYRSNDLKVRNVSGNTVDGVTINPAQNLTNYAFVDGEDCPLHVSGNSYLSHPDSGNYLTNALEIVLDDIGDDDGNCESGESCLYSPNIGAYQGEVEVVGDGGDDDGLCEGTEKCYGGNNYVKLEKSISKLQSCDFVDGLVSSVTMYSFPSNGR